MGLLLLSFVAGMLTIVAPCVLPILPVLLGGSVVNGKKSRPGVIVLSFAVSVLIFTLSIQLLLEVFGLQLSTITKVSGVLLISMGLLFLFPKVRQRLMEKTGIESATTSASGSTQGGVWGDIVTGAVLGPVFNTCSPTFIILVSTILPQNFVRGLSNILVYIAGLCLVLSLIIVGGRAVIKKLKRFANPNGIFKKIIACILIIVGGAILMGWDKDVEAYIVQNGLWINTINWELNAVGEYK